MIGPRPLQEFLVLSVAEVAPATMEISFGNQNWYSYGGRSKLLPRPIRPIIEHQLTLFHLKSISHMNPLL